MQRLFSFFFPFFFPIEWPGYPSPPRKAAAQKKVFQQLAPRFGRIGKLWDCTTNQRHNRGTFRIPSHSNTPSYRQQVRALFRYISSSRFSCGYFGMHSYIFTSICTAARGRLLGLCTLSRTALPHPQLLHSCFARSALSYTHLLSTISPFHSTYLSYKYAIWSISGCPFAFWLPHSLSI